jgi:hypothetical protein
MSIINWQKVRRETDIPKDRRLLLIGQPTNVTPDGGLLDTYDVVVGHWNRHRGAFMPVHLDFQSYERPILNVTHWAELTVPRGVQLRDISQEVERHGPAGFD